MARKRIVEVCKFMMSEWESGRDWRWPSAGHETLDKLKKIELDSKWDDYTSLASVYWFLYRAAEAVLEGMSVFNHISWDEALMALQESARRLEKGLKIEDPFVLEYKPKGVAAGCNPFSALMRLFNP